MDAARYFQLRMLVEKKCRSGPRLVRPGPVMGEGKGGRIGPMAHSSSGAVKEARRGGSSSPRAEEANEGFNELDAVKKKGGTRPRGGHMMVLDMSILVLGNSPPPTDNI